MEAGGLYIFQGKSSANSLLIENATEAKKLLSLLDRYLSDYIHVLDYCLKEDGWHFLVKLKSKKTILKNYEAYINKSPKAFKRVYSEVWRIISEMVRIWRFQYVQWTNRQENRTGGKVACNYERFIIESEEEAAEYIQKIREGSIDLSQQNIRYKANYDQYDENFEISNNRQELTSKVIQEFGKVSKFNWVKSLYLWGSQYDMLYKLIHRTRILHLKSLKHPYPLIQ